MNLTRLPHDPGALADFFQEALESLGAVCDRTWHDRLQLVAESAAARLWNDDGGLFETELQFAAPGTTSPRDARRDIFPGCPLTFRLAEALFPNPLALDYAVLSVPEANRPPAMDVAQKLWRAQWPGDGPWRLESAFCPVHHFSLVALVRAEFQAIDQHWSLHRVAVAMADGGRDESLARALEFADLVAVPDPPPAWPAVQPAGFRECIDRALGEDLARELAPIRERQQRYLERELHRVDDYFEGYIRELEGRGPRSGSESARIKIGDRVTAARSEHERRRADQIHRHEVRIIPRIDSLLLVAEPAWEATVRSGYRGENRTETAHLVPRSRHWHLDPVPPVVRGTSHKV